MSILVIRRPMEYAAFTGTWAFYRAHPNNPNAVQTRTGLRQKWRTMASSEISVCSDPATLRAIAQAKESPYMSSRR